MSLRDYFQSKWLPLHTLAASGEFYLLDALLKHNVDLNAPDKVEIHERLKINFIYCPVPSIDL